MAKRNNRSKPASGATTAGASGATEQRVIAFAEQLGRFVGTIQAKADGWKDRETLNRQIASVRDGAVQLLDQLAGSEKKESRKKTVAARRVSKGRSGGAVDAPGKKHRKMAPPDPDATIADAQESKMRMAKPMVKVHQRRGRGRA